MIHYLSCWNHHTYHKQYHFFFSNFIYITFFKLCMCLYDMLSFIKASSCPANYKRLLHHWSTEVYDWPLSPLTCFRNWTSWAVQSKNKPWFRNYPGLWARGWPIPIHCDSNGWLNSLDLGMCYKACATYSLLIIKYRLHFHSSDLDECWMMTASDDKILSGRLFSECVGQSHHSLFLASQWGRAQHECADFLTDLQLIHITFSSWSLIHIHSTKIIIYHHLIIIG